MLEGEQTKRVFHFFDDFDLTSPLVANLNELDTTTVTKMGQKYVNVNGKIYTVTFEKDGYFAVGLLKTMKKHSDNLMMEYVNGLFLSQFCSIVPSLLPTYGFYRFDRPAYEVEFDLASLKRLTKIDLEGYNWEEQCRDAEKCVLLTQYLDKSQTLTQFFDNKHCKKYIMGVLFQVYYTLYVLRGNFTHKDLHVNNVLVHDFGGPVTFVFRHPDDGREKTFSCRYLAKLIDVSRANTRNAPGLTSESMFAAIHRTTCGNSSMYTLGNHPLDTDKAHLKVMKGAMRHLKQMFPDVVEFNTLLRNLYSKKDEVPVIASVPALVDWLFQREFDYVIPNELATMVVDGRNPMQFHPNLAVRATYEDDADLKTPATVADEDEGEYEGPWRSATMERVGKRLSMSNSASERTRSSSKRSLAHTSKRSRRSRNLFE